MEDKLSNRVLEFSLSQNYPNPFNPSTTIAYSVKTFGHVTIAVYNLVGHRVRVLTARNHEPGEYRVIWDGKDGSGKAVSSGLYFYRIETPYFEQTKQLVLLR
ncbi:MAG: T9SS type A sorting domain-containing protein [bacterium]